MFEVVEIAKTKTVTTKAACNHVYVVDVSGSMGYELPKIRQNLKNIIGLSAREGDTFSVIFFSGAGQCGVVFENFEITSNTDVGLVQDAIDRRLKPIGLTSFCDPIELAMNLDLAAGKLNSYIMMTDGYNNVGSRADVLSSVAKLPSKYQSIAFIEYGYYADRDLITQMASACGGMHMFADGYIKYEVVLQNVVDGVPRVNNIEVKVNKAAKDCIFIHGNVIRIVPVTDGIAIVPEDVERVHSIVPKDVLSKRLSEDHLYLVLHYAHTKGNSELVWNVLQVLGDVALVNAYSNAFTKQELSAFGEMVETAVLDKSARFVEGKDVNAVPKKNAPTIIDLLRVLESSDAELVVTSPDWNYKRIGRGRIAEETLPRFIQSPFSSIKMGGLVFNSERPNVSLSASIDGVVELPENEFGLTKVKSKIIRNYTLVRDGIVNVDSLPVVFSASQYDVLSVFPHDIVDSANGRVYCNFNLRKIPVVNRASVESVDVDTFVSENVSALEKKAEIRAIGHLIDQHGGGVSKITGLIDQYGEEAAKWLSSIGVRDYGFSPVGTKSTEADDEYESVQVTVGFKGISSIPSVDAVNKKAKEGKKFNNGDMLLSAYIAKYAGYSLKELETAKNLLVAYKRRAEFNVAKQVYALVLGRKWFGDEDVFETSAKVFGVEGDVPVTIKKIRKMIAI